MFNQKQFKKELTTSWIGHDLIYLEKVGSTNSYLRKMDAENVQDGTLCLTDNQTRGRGQYERQWLTRAGKNLTFTIAFQPSRIDGLHILTLACALAITETVGPYLLKNTRIKWPNDIYYEDRKLGGILTESIFSGNTLDRVLVGIGINVNQKSFPPSLEDNATSLCRILQNETFDRESLLASILQKIEYNYICWKKNDTELLKKINRNIIGYGQWVHLYLGDQRLNGKSKFLGINQEGNLVVLTSEDEVKKFSYEQVRIATD